MAINRSIKLAWNGESVNVSLTMSDINELEKSGELFELAQAIGTGQPRTALTAIVLSKVFSIGGMEVPEEDIFNELTKSPEDKEKILIIVSEIVNAVWGHQKKSSTTSKKPRKASK